MFSNNSHQQFGQSPQQSLQQQDPGRILLDFSTPFDQSKAQALTLVVQTMFSGRAKPADVSNFDSRESRNRPILTSDVLDTASIREQGAQRVQGTRECLHNCGLDILAVLRQQCALLRTAGPR